MDTQKRVPTINLSQICDRHDVDCRGKACLARQKRFAFSNDLHPPKFSTIFTSCACFSCHSGYWPVRRCPYTERHSSLITFAHVAAGYYNLSVAPQTQWAGE